MHIHLVRNCAIHGRNEDDAPRDAESHHLPTGSLCGKQDAVDIDVNYLQDRF